MPWKSVEARRAYKRSYYERRIGAPRKSRDWRREFGNISNVEKKRIIRREDIDKIYAHYGAVAIIRIS